MGFLKRILEASVRLLDADRSAAYAALACEADVLLELFSKEGDLFRSRRVVQEFHAFLHFDHAGCAVAFAATERNVRARVVDRVLETRAVLNVNFDVVLGEYYACHDELLNRIASTPCGTRYQREVVRFRCVKTDLIRSRPFFTEGYD